MCSQCVKLPPLVCRTDGGTRTSHLMSGFPTRSMSLVLQSLLGTIRDSYCPPWLPRESVMVVQTHVHWGVSDNHPPFLLQPKCGRLISYPDKCAERHDSRVGDAVGCPPSSCPAIHLAGRGSFMVQTALSFVTLHLLPALWGTSYWAGQILRSRTAPAPGKPRYQELRQ